MGVDIYGRKPKIVSEKPDEIDFQASTDDQKQKYWNKIDEWDYQHYLDNHI